jgi:hypothetical protein
LTLEDQWGANECTCGQLTYFAGHESEVFNIVGFVDLRVASFAQQRQQLVLVRQQRPAFQPGISFSLFFRKQTTEFY